VLAGTPQHVPDGLLGRLRIIRRDLGEGRAAPGETAQHSLIVQMVVALHVGTPAWWLGVMGGSGDFHLHAIEEVVAPSGTRDERLQGLAIRRRDGGPRFERNFRRSVVYPLAQGEVTHVAFRGSRQRECGREREECSGKTPCHAGTGVACHAADASTGSSHTPPWYPAK